jgi:hypothetical protein
LISSAFLKTGVAACAVLILVGCATTTGLVSSGARYDPNKPQTFLPGATVDQAKGVAMGAAASKGWSVLQSTDDTLLLQRVLDAAAAEGNLPGASVAPLPPVVQVRSSFFRRDLGVDVVLDAQVVTGRGTEQERSVDFTDNYRQELMQSLASLRQAWSTTGSRVASAIPPLPTSAAAPSSPAAAGAASAGGEAAAVPVASAAATQPVALAGPAGTSAWGPTRFSAPEPEPIPEPVVRLEERSLASAPAPVEEASRPAAPVALAGTAPERSANMLVLNPPTDTGLWSYYAEHYARIRGCDLADGGAVLIEKQNYSETHRVDCAGGRSFLVRCNAGVCRGLR